MGISLVWQRCFVIPAAYLMKYMHKRVCKKKNWEVVGYEHMQKSKCNISLIYIAVTIESSIQNLRSSSCVMQYIQKL